MESKRNEIGNLFDLYCGGLIPGPANDQRDMQNKDTSTLPVLQKQAHYTESCMYICRSPQLGQHLSVRYLVARSSF